jgi:thiol-disulfide isomerase/thioredoxin
MINFILFLVLSSVKADEFPPDSPVLRMSNQMFFDNAISQPEQNNSWLIMFFAPWCPHCKKLIPLWTELAIGYQDNADSNVIVASVDW